MSNTGRSRPTLRRRLVSESEADPLNSMINPRNNSGMNFPSDRAESNPKISGFIDTGPGTRLQSQREGNETNTDKIAKLLFRLQIDINEWEASVKSKAYFSSSEINNRFFMLNSDVD